MQCSYESLEGFSKRIIVELDAGEVARCFAKVFSDFAFRYHIDGVQDGSATPEQIEAAFGGPALMNAAANTIHTTFFPLAMDKLDLVGLGSAAYIASQMPLPTNPYTFTAEVECSPIVELSSYDPLEVSLPTLPANAPDSEQMLQRLKETEALQALAARVQGELPEVLCDAEEESIVQAVYAQANQADVSFVDYLAQQGLDLETFNQDVARRAQASVRSDLALDAWAAHAGFEVSEQRIAEEFARQNLASPALEQAEWRASGRIPQLRQAIRRRMALDDIVFTMIVIPNE